LFLSVVTFGCGAPGGVREPKDKVLLKVNETKITVADFQKELDRLLPNLKPLASDKEWQRRFLDEIITRELLLQEAERLKLGEQPEIAERVKDFKRRLLLESLLNQEVANKVKVSDEEAESYFTAHPKEFKTAKVRAKHILVGSEQEAQAILERLKRKEKFEDLARKLSLDRTSGEKGGDLGDFGHGQMVPEFEQTAFTLKPGETSGVVKSSFGYHIIKVVDRQEAPLPRFAEVKEQLRQRLLREKQQKRFDEWVASLRKVAKVSVQEDLLPVGSSQGKPEAPQAKGK